LEFTKCALDIYIYRSLC